MAAYLVALTPIQLCSGHYLIKDYTNGVAVYLLVGGSVERDATFQDLRSHITTSADL